MHPKVISVEKLISDIHTSLSHIDEIYGILARSIPTTYLIEELQVLAQAIPTEYLIEEMDNRGYEVIYHGNGDKFVGDRSEEVGESDEI